MGEMLAYLAYHAGRPQRREALIEAFFPDAAESTFRVALNRLRRLLEAPDLGEEMGLVSDRTHVWLEARLFVTDVAEFDAAIRAARKATQADAERAFLEVAVGLYRGELLPGYDNDWIVPERLRLAEAYIRALSRLAVLAADGGDLEQAQEHAQRAVRADPLREDTQRELIRLYLAQGRTAAARRQYGEFQRVLSDMLGMAPSREMEALIATAGARPVAPRSGSRPNAVAATGVSRLPATFTPLFGREDEIERVLDHLLDGTSSLITLTGMGGTGKTRLALEVAHRLRPTVEAIAGCIYWVPLSHLTEASQIVGAIADAIREVSPATPADSLPEIARALSTQPSVLALDNFEHLHTDGVVILQELRQRLPQLTCLVTSRQRLSLPGEIAVPIPPLDVPARAGTPALMLEFPAIQLFVDRARTIRPEFQVTARNITSIVRLCDRLEGIPLAIELAAAWIEVMSPSEILAHLSQRFVLLVSDRTDISPRHRTLQAAVAWSYHLLPEEIQRFFARLSVFRGGWTEESAQWVCQEPQALHFLRALRERSLILAEQMGDGTRFRMLETLREFGAEHLSAAETEALEDRHRDRFVTLAETAYSHRTDAQFPEWLQRLEVEQDNLRAALRPVRCPEDDDRPLRLASALWLFWYVRGHFAEGLEQLKRTLAAAPATPSAARSRALHGAGTLAVARQDLTLARQFHEEALALSRTLGDPVGIAGALGSLGMLACNTADVETARACFHEALTRFQELGSHRNVVATRNNLGVLALQCTDLSGARRHFEAGLALRSEVNDGRVIACLLSGLGSVARRAGNTEKARQSLREALRLQQEAANPAGVIDILVEFAALAITLHDPACGALLLGVADHQREQLGFSFCRYAADQYTTQVAQVQEALTPETLEALRRRNAGMSLEQAIALTEDIGDSRYFGDLPHAQRSLTRIAATYGDPCGVSADQPDE